MSMKKMIFIFFLIPLISFTQNEKNNTKEIADSIVYYFNSENTSKIFSKFSENVKKEVPENEVSDFLEGLKTSRGEITKIELTDFSKKGEIMISVFPKIGLSISSSPSPIASYKVYFKKFILNMEISVNKNEKISSINFIPYTDKKVSQNVINGLNTNHNSINERQKKLIYNNAKYFPNNTQVSFALIQNGNITYYGIERVKDSIYSVENYRNIFEIGSISKLFTSNILSHFILNKKLQLKDNVFDYIDIKSDKIEDLKISFESLSNHTSGLPRMPNNFSNSSKKDPLNPYSNYSLNEFKSYLSDSLKINTNSIGKFQYSNLGVALLGYTLSKINKSDYKSMFDSYVFGKYEMNNTTFDREKISSLLVRGLNNEGDELPNWDLKIFGPAGGVLSNVEDLSKYAVANYDKTNKELLLSRNKTFKINKKRSVGLGWFILKSSAYKKRVYTHSGNTSGYSSFIGINTYNKNGIILLSNVSGFNPNLEKLNTLGFKLLKNLKKN